MAWLASTRAVSLPFSVQPDAGDEYQLIAVPRDRRAVGEVDVVARRVEEASSCLALHVRRERVNQTGSDITAHLSAPTRLHVTSHHIAASKQLSK